MALFKGEALPEVKDISFSRRTAPTVSNPNAIVWLDQVQGSLLGVVAQTNVAPELLCYQNTTPVNCTNTANVTTLMTAPININLVNAVGKVLKVHAAGYYNTGTPTGGPTALTFVVAMGGTNVLSYTTAATTNSATTMPWQINGTVDVVNNGVNANVEAHAALAITLGTNANAATTTYLDSNNAVVGTINLQANANVALIVSQAHTDATTSIVQRIMTVTVAN